MSVWQNSTHETAQGGDERGGESKDEGRGHPKRSGSGLARVEITGKVEPGLKSSIIARRIEEILVLSAYSKEVILINPHAFRIKSRLLIVSIYTKINAGCVTAYVRTANKSIEDDLLTVF